MSAEGSASGGAAGQTTQVLIVDTHTHVISDDHEKYPLQVADYPGVEWVYEAPVTVEELKAELLRLKAELGDSDEKYPELMAIRQQHW